MQEPLPGMETYICVMQRWTMAAPKIRSSHLLCGKGAEGPAADPCVHPTCTQSHISCGCFPPVTEKGGAHAGPFPQDLDPFNEQLLFLSFHPFNLKETILLICN